MSTKIDFPSTPSANDTYTQNGITWLYNGRAWVNTTANLVADDTAYGTSWDSNLEAASKNAIYDKIESLPDDSAYSSSWDNSTNLPTQNAIYDKIESLSISAEPSDNFSWTFDGSTTVLSDPGSGIFRFNSLNPTQVTQLRIDDLCSSGVDTSLILDDFKSGYIYIEDRSGNALLYEATSSTDFSGYFVIALVWVSGTTLLSDGDECFFRFFKKFTTELSEDTSPRLSGNLNVDSYSLVNVNNDEFLSFASQQFPVNHVEIQNANTNLAPTIRAAGNDPNISLFLYAKGSGNIRLGQFLFDANQSVSLGNDNDVLTYDGSSGEISLQPLPPSGLQNVVEDTTPQLGGMLDVTTHGLGDGTDEVLSFVVNAGYNNHVQLENNKLAVDYCKITTAGDDADIPLHIDAKGQGIIRLASNTSMVNRLDYFSGQAIGDGTTTFSWSEKNFTKFTFGSQNEVFTFQNPALYGVSYSVLHLVLIQDGVGGRTVTWPASVKWVNGIAPTLSTAANAVDIIKFIYDGTNYYGSYDPSLAGPRYGMLYSNNNTSTVTCSVTPTAVDWLSAGPSSGTTPDTTNNYITIAEGGLYRVEANICCNTDVAGEYQFELYYFDGTSWAGTGFVADRAMPNNGDVGSVTVSGVVDVAAGGQARLAVYHSIDAGSTTNFLVQSGQLVVTKL